MHWRIPMCSREKWRYAPRVGGMNTSDEFSRRILLRGATVSVLGTSLLAVAPPCIGAPFDNGDAPGPVDLGPADAVPVGGGKIYRKQRVVVSRSAEGDYRAYQAVCTHAGCTLDKVERQVGVCPCHGSHFDVMTGKVLRGPAAEPLPPVPLWVSGGRLMTCSESADREEPEGSRIFTGPVLSPDT
ncbi:ubiquinol-cytochrome c reductase iron-sulfur subunit [Streptomyces sp. NPDC059002]|uniref:QcrA and Rieske domain-containing protein n=1 Tax=Streptomyces sp. NPDC059002 TaxID=3346690 RepID=UPI00367D40D9